MRIYLDTCAIQRPLDALSQLRVRVEADLILAILTAIEEGEVSIITSDVPRFEVENVPLAYRRDFAQGVLALAVENVATTPEVSLRAGRYVNAGIKPLDAVHLASAVEADADAFCTTDGALLRKGQRQDTARTLVVSPLQLIAKLSP